MNQPTDFNAMVQGAILGTAARLTGMMFLDLIFNVMPWERADAANPEPRAHLRGLGGFKSVPG